MTPGESGKRIYANQADIGGGGPYEFGGYAIGTARIIFGGEPARCIGLFENDPGLGMDRLASGHAEFSGGRHLTFTTSTQLVPYQRVQICGTKGRIEVKVPLNTEAGSQTTQLTDDGTDLTGGNIRREVLPSCDQYALQGKAISAAVRGRQALEYGLDDAIANMRVINAAFRSRHSGYWEKP